MSTLVLELDYKGALFDVRKIQVREGIGAPFEVSVFARSPSPDVDLEAIVGKPGGVAIHQDPMAEPRAWTGVIRHAEQIQVEPTGLSTYHFIVAPRIWLLTKRTGNRIFHHMTIPDIVKKVLSEYGIEAKQELSETHEAHEYRVQFGESDFNFVCRLLEEEGISTLFRSVAKGAGHTSEMVLRDKPQSAPARPGPPIPWNDAPTERSRHEFATSLRIGQRVRGGAHLVRDHDFARPDLFFVGQADKAKAPEDQYEHYAYNPAAFVKERQGKPRATPETETNEHANIALQATRQDRREVRFETNCFDAGPGTVLAIAGHPRSDLPAGKKLLVAEAQLEATPDETWEYTVSCTYADLPFRPKQLAKKPVMRGVQSAIVTGPAGQEIHTDEFGRVRVQFFWDRDGQHDEKSSCWVRVSQGWAGSAFGLVTLPRIGHEVIVDFFEGDPDQPIVVGRVYNNRTKVPYRLPDHKTKSTWKSNSSPRSEGFNEIMMEDKAGKELLFVQAERDLSKLVKHDEMERTGVSRGAVVGANRTLLVGNLDSHVIGKKYAVTMAKPKDLQIEKQGDPEAEPLKTTVEMQDGHIALTTGKMTALFEEDTISLFGDRDIVLKSGGDITINGSHVYINTKNYTGRAPQADEVKGPPVGAPEGRVLDAIKKVFGFGKKAEPPQAPTTELVVPHVEQEGGTCGLAAMAMVMAYWNQKDPKLPAPHFKDDLLKKAQEKGWTTTGGMWEHDEAKLAKEYGYDAVYKAGASMDDIKKAIGEGKPVLITFSVDMAGEPKKGTDRGHYAVITGYFSKDGKDYVKAQHGWGSAKNKVWEQSAFEESWKSYGGKKMVVVSPKGGTP